MQSFTCPICGGKLKIKVGAELAVCEACGNVTELDSADVRRFRAVYDRAERMMRQNTVVGYREAIRLFASIPFVSCAKEKQAECEKRLSELQSRIERRRVLLHREDEKSTKLGIVLLILTLLFAVAAIAGIVYLIILWTKGTLSRPAVIVIVSIAVVAVALALFSRLRGGN